MFDNQKPIVIASFFPSSSRKFLARGKNKREESRKTEAEAFTIYKVVFHRSLMREKPGPDVFLLEGRVCNADR